MDGAARRPVTLREVAAAAAVSQATVSRVLSGSAAVSPGLSRRVLGAAEALGYAPNLSARSLASGRTATVGVVVPNLANPYFYALIKRMTHDAEVDGYRLLIADSDEKVPAETALCDGLLRQADGLIMCSPRGPESDLNRLRGLGRPIVVFGRDGTAPDVSRVFASGTAAIRDLVDHLAQLGHRELLYLRGPRHSWQDQQRFRAYRAAAAGRLAVRALACGGSMEDGLRLATRVPGSGARVVVSYNDLVAFGVVAGLADLGVSVPDDVSVTGYDDIPFARFLTPALTTIASPQEEAGAETWRAMSGLLRGETAGTRVTLSCRLVIRDSTAAPAFPPAVRAGATVAAGASVASPAARR
jgi:DNA-binding LacI/PurR family transcriptional regulator